MDAPSRLEAKGLARARIRTRRRRVRAIRRGTVRGSLVLFTLVWAIVFVQLVSGGDPALSRSPVADRRSTAPSREDPKIEFPPEAEPEAVEPEVEAVEPEVVEPEVETVEPEVEAVEPESVEAEPAPEPEPLVTSAS